MKTISFDVNVPSNVTITATEEGDSVNIGVNFKILNTMDESKNKLVDLINQSEETNQYWSVAKEFLDTLLPMDYESQIINFIKKLRYDDRLLFREALLKVLELKINVCIIKQHTEEKKGEC